MNQFYDEAEIDAWDGNGKPPKGWMIAQMVAEAKWIYNPNRVRILNSLLKVLEEKRD